MSDEDLETAKHIIDTTDDIARKLSLLCLVMCGGNRVLAAIALQTAHAAADYSVRAFETDDCLRSYESCRDKLASANEARTQKLLSENRSRSDAPLPDVNDPHVN